MRDMPLTPCERVRRALRQAGYVPLTTYPISRRHRLSDTAAFSLWRKEGRILCVQEYLDGGCYVYTPYASRLQEVLEALAQERTAPGASGDGRG